MLFHNRPNIKKKQYNMKYDHIDIQKNKCSDRIQERMRNNVNVELQYASMFVELEREAY